MNDADIASLSSRPGTAVITGASSGIGATYAARLARRGYDLLLVARRTGRLMALADSLRAEHGVHVDTLTADLVQAADIERVAARLDHDDVTMIVNNAGIATFVPVADISLDSLNAMTEINVSALVHLSHVALAAFKRRNRGTIVNIGSVLGFQTLPFSAGYSGTKGYVLGFTRGLQEEAKDTGVIVQLVVPSATATDIWDASGVPLSALEAGTIMSVEDLVDAALAGLDLGELVTLPSLEDEQLLVDYEKARLNLFAGAQSGKVASRYLEPAKVSG